MQNKSKVKTKIAAACKAAVKLAGLTGVINPSDMVSELLSREELCACDSGYKLTDLSRKKLIVSSSSSSSNSESDSNSNRDCRHHKNKGKKKKLKSGMTDKPKNSNIRKKLQWATSMIDSKNDVSFDDLSFDQYIQGETQILNRSRISTEESKTCIFLMKRISKVNEKLPFSKSKELYRDTLLSIEKGELDWMNFYEIEHIENDIRFSNMKVSDSPDASKSKKTSSSELEIWWSLGLLSNPFSLPLEYFSLVSDLPQGTTSSLRKSPAVPMESHHMYIDSFCSHLCTLCWLRCIA